MVAPDGLVMKILKICVVLGLVFVAGIAVGVGGTQFAVKRIVEQAARRPETVRDRMEQELARELNLTAEQRPKVHEVFLRGHDDLQSLRKDFQPRLVMVLVRREREIRAVLDPAQRERFERMLKRRPFAAGVQQVEGLPQK